MDHQVVKIAMPADLEAFADAADPETAAALEAAWMHRLQASFELIMFPLRHDASRERHVGPGCPPFRETIGQRFTHVAEFDQVVLDEMAVALLAGRKVIPEYVYKYRASRAAASLLKTLF